MARRRGMVVRWIWYWAIAGDAVAQHDRYWWNVANLQSRVPMSMVHTLHLQVASAGNAVCADSKGNARFVLLVCV